MLGVTTKTIKVLDITGIERGMILSLEDTMSFTKFNVVVKNVYDHTSAFDENMIKAVVISGNNIGEEISITADHTYSVKKAKIVEVIEINKNDTDEQRKQLEELFKKGMNNGNMIFY